MIIIDFSAVFYANVHQMNNINKGVFEIDLLRHMLLNSIRATRQKFLHEYGEVVLACDDNNYWRKEVFPQYKANRKKGRENSEWDWDEIFEMLNTLKAEFKESFPYVVLQIDRAEADDIIGALCNEYHKSLKGIMIVSADKDFVQLQKYPNVKQWDPIRKRLLTHEDPAAYKIEHIIRGDGGDGVPNMLSPDNALVEGIRQTPISKKFVEKYLTMAAFHAIIHNEDEAKGYERNQRMVDLDFIPEDINKQIIDDYIGYERNDRSGILNYLIKHQLRQLTSSLNQL